jgi:hypothetical protein
MGPIGKDKLVFDTTATLADNDNVGAYLRASDGTLLTHTDVGGKKRLDVNLATEYLEDAAHASGDRGQFILAVRRDADTSMVDADGDYAPLQVDENGRLKVVADIEVVNGFEKLEDAAHADGDVGAYMLSVRQDVLAGSTSASGDYQSFKTDSVGSLWVRLSQGVALDSPNTAFNTVAQSVAATAGGTQLIAAPLANRKKLLIQNLSNKPVYIIESGQTAADGVRIAAGGNWELEAGPAIDLYAIVDAGTADVRLFELA